MANTNRIRIKQMVENELHWATLTLVDNAGAGGGTVSGKWMHTSDTYTGKVIEFCSDAAEYLYFWWEGDASQGTLKIGTKTGRASHKEEEAGKFDTVYLTLTKAVRSSAGLFRGNTPLKVGDGTFTYGTRPHFVQGDFVWLNMTDVK